MIDPFLKKTRFIFLLSILLLALSCDDNESITGSPNIIEESRAAGEISTIDINGIVEVSITYGDNPSVSVRSNDNFINLIETEITDKTLFIDVNTSANEYTNVVAQVKVITPILEKVVSNGISGITISDFINLDHLQIENDGIGAIQNTGSAKHLELELSGIGAYEGFGFIAQTCNVNLSGIGSAELTVSDALTGQLTGIGSLMYKGDATVNVSRTGTGSIVDSN